MYCAMIYTVQISLKAEQAFPHQNQMKFFREKHRKTNALAIVNPQASLRAPVAKTYGG